MVEYQIPSLRDESSSLSQPVKIEEIEVGRVYFDKVSPDLLFNKFFSGETGGFMIGIYKITN